MGRERGRGTRGTDAQARKLRHVATTQAITIATFDYGRPCKGQCVENCGHEGVAPNKEN